MRREERGWEGKKKEKKPTCAYWYPYTAFAL
jgi:hypothetical protein